MVSTGVARGTDWFSGAVTGVGSGDATSGADGGATGGPLGGPVSDDAVAEGGRGGPVGLLLGAASGEAADCLEAVAPGGRGAAALGVGGSGAAILGAGGRGATEFGMLGTAGTAEVGSGGAPAELRTGVAGARPLGAETGGWGGADDGADRGD